MRKTLFIVLVVLLATSCNRTFYQVYKVEAPGLQEKQNSLVYENEDCIVSYNLWGDHGNMAFWMTNKTDKDLFVNLDRTFFIKDGVAYNYYQAREWQNAKISSTSITDAASVSAGAGLTGALTLWGDIYSASVSVSKSLFASKSKSRTVSSSVTVKEQPVICIPAHSSKLISEYTINSKTYLSCIKKVDYPKRESVAAKYQPADSPLRFSNRIAYSTSPCRKDMKFMNHTFWLSEISNYSKKAAFMKEKVKPCYGREKVGVEYFKIASPRKFYNVMQKKGI